ncbi:hypothetical protein MKW92_047098 [Papaver armeniacum]|nr:hypothetical protein MKW92_047098 [Papaver armeniacum]
MILFLCYVQVIAAAAAASPIVESGNKRGNKRDAGEETEMKLKKMKTIQEFSNGNDSSTKGFGNRIGLAPRSQKEKFSSETDSSSMKVVAAASAASPDFKSVNKRGVNKRIKLKKKAGDFKKKKKNEWRRVRRLRARWKRNAEKTQEFSNGNLSSNDPTTPSAPQPTTSSAPQVLITEASKTVTARNIPVSIHKSEIIEFFKQAGEVVNACYVKLLKGNRHIEYKGGCHIEFATEEAAKKALELDGQNLCNREIVVERYGTRTTGASKTLIAKHLSLFITKSDVIKLFKLAGEIIDVRFSSLDNGKFSGHCHIEFATEEGAQKAAELNGQYWLGRPLELGFAHETIYVRGFDTSIEFDQIHSSLEKLFSTCGKILSMEIPTVPYTNVTLGKAFIEFYDFRAFPKALAMNGHKFGDSTLRVEDATPLELDVKPPGPRRTIGGRPVGPYYSICPCRFFPHRGWGGTGIGKHDGVLFKSRGWIQ